MPLLPLVEGSPEANRKKMKELTMKLGPRGPLRQRCAYCHKTKSQLLRCASCNVAYYCSKDHLDSHDAHHKIVCEPVKATYDHVKDITEASNQAKPPSQKSTIGFKTSTELFKTLENTSYHRHLRFVTIIELKNIGTFEAVKQAVGHCNEMRGLSDHDEYGIRYRRLWLLIQQGEEQKSYDDLKWMAINNDREDEWPPTVNIPIHTGQDPDMYEGIGFVDQSDPNLELVAPLHLIKLKLLLDVRTIRDARRRPSETRLPKKTVDSLQCSLSKTIIKMPMRDLQKLEQRLINQCQRLGEIACSVNVCYWRAIFEAEKHAYNRFRFFYTPPGSWDQVLNKFFDSLVPIWQADGLLELLTHAKKYGRRRYEEARAEAEDRRKTNPESANFAWDEVSNTRNLWAHFDDAWDALKDEESDSSCAEHSDNSYRDE